MAPNQTQTNTLEPPRQRRVVLGIGLAIGLGVGVAVGLFAGSHGGASIDDDGTTDQTSLGQIEEILREPQGFARVEHLSRVLSSVDATPHLDLRDILESPQLRISSAESLLLLRFWANQSATDAFDWAWSQSPPAYRSAAVDLTTELLATADPALALRSIRAHAPSRSSGARGGATDNALIRGWLASGEPGVEDYIRDLGIGFARQRSLSAYARERIRRNEIESLEQWAESLPDEPRRFKLAAFRQIGSELAIYDPALGVAWCDKHCDGPFGLSVRQLVATRWAATDGRAALEWASQYPDDPTIHLAIRDAYRTWYRADSEAALAFVDELGFERAVGSWFSPAVGLYAALIAPTRPAEALRWALAEEDPERSESNVLSILRRWRAIDEAAAEAWLESSTLTEKARRMARQPIPNQRARRAAGPGDASGE
jgi:hypothetical protein